MMMLSADAMYRVPTTNRMEIESKRTFSVASLDWEWKHYGKFYGTVMIPYKSHIYIINKVCAHPRAFMSTYFAI